MTCEDCNQLRIKLVKAEKLLVLFQEALEEIKDSKGILTAVEHRETAQEALAELARELAWADKPSRSRQSIY